jgi:hypothetical protein
MRERCRVLVGKNLGFILIALAATLSLVCTLTPVPYEYHFYARVLMCLAIITIMLGWRTLKLFEIAALMATAIIYNPIIPIQLGSSIAWIIIASLILSLSTIKILDKTSAVEPPSD